MNNPDNAPCYVVSTLRKRSGAYLRIRRSKEAMLRLLQQEAEELYDDGIIDGTVPEPPLFETVHGAVDWFNEHNGYDEYMAVCDTHW